MADDMPALDSPPVVIPATVLAKLRVIPSTEETTAAERRLAAWLDDDSARSTDVPTEIRDEIIDLQDRGQQAREAVIELVAIIDALGTESVADKVARAADDLSQLAEVASGYRTKMIAAGFSNDIAEQCAMQIHSVMASALMQP